MKIRKNIIALMSVAVLSVGLVGCSSSEGSVTNNESSVAQTTTDVKEETTTQNVDGKLGDYIVKIKSSEKFTTSSGTSGLKVVMDFTNNSQETTSFDMVTMPKAFQDGIEIDMAFDVANLGDSSSKQIRPGATIEVTIGFELSNEESPVEVEVSEFLSLTNDRVLETINLQ